MPFEVIILLAILTGAAQMGATALITAVGDLGPRWVVAGLFIVTVLGMQVIPTAALVVLMAPMAPHG